MQQHHAAHAQHAQEGIAHGVHIMAIGKETVVPDILQAANL
jgi:5,10-methylenetetrahydrofolate reductase